MFRVATWLVFNLAYLPLAWFLLYPHDPTGCARGVCIFNLAWFCGYLFRRWMEGRR